MILHTTTTKSDVFSWIKAVSGIKCIAGVKAEALSYDKLIAKRDALNEQACDYMTDHIQSGSKNSLDIAQKLGVESMKLDQAIQQLEILGE